MLTMHRAKESMIRLLEKYPEGIDGFEVQLLNRTPDSAPSTGLSNQTTPESTSPIDQPDFIIK